MSQSSRIHVRDMRDKKIERVDQRIIRRRSHNVILTYDRAVLHGIKQHARCKAKWDMNNKTRKGYDLHLEYRDLQ